MALFGNLKSELNQTWFIDKYGNLYMFMRLKVTNQSQSQSQRSSEVNLYDNLKM